VSRRIGAQSIIKSGSMISAAEVAAKTIGDLRAERL
jgi:hypothetical protein